MGKTKRIKRRAQTLWVLKAELYAPGFSRRAFGCGNMGLKLDRIGSGPRGCIDIGMRHAETSVVGLGDFGGNQAGSAGPDELFSDFYVCCHRAVSVAQSARSVQFVLAKNCRKYGRSELLDEHHQTNIHTKSHLKCQSYASSRGRFGRCPGRDRHAWHRKLPYDSNRAGTRFCRRTTPGT